MEGYVLINDISKVDHLRSFVRQYLRDNSGVKLPKSKKLKKLNQSRNNSREDLTTNRVFGEHLCHLSTTFIQDHGYVPSFLVEASEIIESQLDSEGIFRKSGSVNRQKELRQTIEEGKSLAGSNIYDVSALVKQFFRELPDPLFSPIFHDAFLKCYQLPLEKEPTQAILQLCLCLPLENIGALRFMLHLFSKVASHSDKNKMTASNLALVMAPNFMHSNKGVQKMNISDEKVLHIEVAIIEILINNCKFVGMVNNTLCHQAALMSECFGTDDDLDASDDNTLEESKNNMSRKKKRKRSGSLTGFVNSITSGLAKLRRNSDGRSINMSSNSNHPNELSITANMSQSNPPVFDSSVTPCVIRRRRVSGESVPFSTTKKKAILGNLPQKSALASTPFTPASTVKRNYHDDSCYIDTSETPRLNCTTPCMGSKTPRKKLNLFNSPGSNKKVKRQASVARMNSPNPREKLGKNRSIFRRLSGNREKIEHGDISSSNQRNAGGSKVSKSGNVSPRSTVSDSALPCHGGVGMGRSASSQSFQGSELTVPSGNAVSSVSLNKGFIYETEVFCDNSRNEQHHTAVESTSAGVTGARSRSADRMNSSGMSQGNRSKSVDSPGLKRGQPNTVNNGLPKSKSLDKSAISGPCPIVIPVVPNAFDVGSGTTPLRRSRREEFEEQNRLKKQWKTQDAVLDKSASSQLDESLMGAVLPPPHGFGDQTVLEDVSHKTSNQFSDHSRQESALEKESVAGFSTISGRLRKTESGNYTKDSAPSCSLTNSTSSCIGSEFPLRSSVSKDSVFSDTSSSYSVISSVSNSKAARDIGKVTDDTFIDVDGVEDTYVSLRAPLTSVNEGDYVTLKRSLSCQVDKNSIVADVSSKGMDLLRENYISEDESTSSCFNSNLEDHPFKGASCKEEIKKVSSRPNIHRKKSISADDLQSSPRINVPVRSRSQYLSPMKRFNYKPHLEISKETHRILARAGYLKDAAEKPHSKDIQVPVKSPKRSSHREEMMLSLRSSFHERINSSRHGRKGDSINQSAVSSLSSIDLHTAESSQVYEEKECLRSNNADNSLLSGWEKLSIVSQNSSMDMTYDGRVKDKNENLESIDKSDLSQRVLEVSEKLQSGTYESKKKEEENVTDTSEEEDSIQAKEPTTRQEAPSGETATQYEISNKALLKDVDKSLTLSGFLEREIQNNDPLKIKRAELLMPKHDSVVNIKEQKAGLVAENVKHFTHRSKYGKSNLNKIGLPPPHKRGTSPIRIPTIFAKSDEKAKQYKEIAQFIRERTGQTEFMSLPQVPPTPGRHSTSGEANSDLEDSISDSNITILDGTVSFSSVSVDHSRLEEGSKSYSGELEDTNNYSTQVLPRLSESLMEKVDLLCTPSKGNNLINKEKNKSPLQESTNTALSSLIGSSSIADSIRLRTAGGLTPHRLPLKSESLLSQRSSQRPQIKRLKGARSPRRVRPKSPHHCGKVQSSLASANTLVSSKQDRQEAEDKASCLLTPVSISLEDKFSEGH